MISLIVIIYFYQRFCGSRMIITNADSYDIKNL